MGKLVKILIKKSTYEEIKDIVDPETIQLSKEIVKNSLYCSVDIEEKYHKKLVQMRQPIDILLLNMARSVKRSRSKS